MISGGQDNLGDVFNIIFYFLDRSAVHNVRVYAHLNSFIICVFGCFRRRQHQSSTYQSQEETSRKKYVQRTFAHALFASRRDTASA